jgi:hypothetical protein
MSPSQVALFKETQVVVDEANKTTEKLMNKMTEEFNDIAMFRLKGQEKPVLNIPSAAIPNFCAWLYFAELGAAHLGDTTAIPQAQKTAIYERLGIQYKIIPRLTSHLRTTKTAQQPTFIKICEAAIAKTGKALVSCGSYEQLSSHENIGYFMRSLGIDEPTYNTLRQQLDTAPKTAAVREGGCPYGHGPK